ncbi:MAG TPA: sulfatase [Anaerolineaceae bacterium]|nr:sulfatase [Anaerolineaceae bacterium]
MKTNLMGNTPNVVLIVLDSVRQDHLSCYGYARKTTPNLDRLAAEGTLFENAYSASCWTIPSHASLFTGLYPSQHRVDLDQPLIHPQHETLAGHLKTLGYATACISCNSFAAGGGTNLNRDFDLTLDVDGGFARGTSTLARGVRHLQKRWRAFIRRDRGADRATRLARDWLGAQSGPFFLFMNYMDCHLPYRLRRPQRFQFIPPMERKRVSRIPLDPFAVMAGQLALKPREVAGIRALYDGSLFYLDQQIGRLVARLMDLGLYEQTIFLVTADHGESFGEHGLFDHQYGLYEHLLRVPLIARFPNGSLAGARIAHPIQHVDLLPVLARLLSGPSAGLDETEYTFLREPLRSSVLAEYLAPNLNAIRRRFPAADVSRYATPLRAIHTQGYKLIARPDGRRELYDLVRDPEECDDLAAAKPEKAAALQARLEEVLGPWPGSEPPAGLSLEKELKERLEAMGYL